MSRNTESRFAKNPTNISIVRSKMPRHHSVKFTGNVGALVPFLCEEILPGDTFQMKTNKVVRLQTMLTPMMDNLYMDTYYFFVPNRLIWEHWRNLMGENTTSAWLPTVEYSAPQITAPVDGWAIGSIADYLGLPTGVPNLVTSALPFRAVAKVYDDWFRDQNLVDPFVIPMGDATQTGTNGSDFKTDCANGGMPFIAAKYHDFFTSATLAPQKGADVKIPVAEAGAYNVVGNGKGLGITDGTLSGSLLSSNGWSGAFGLMPIGAALGTAYNANETAGWIDNKVVGVPTAEQLGDDLSDSGLIAVASGNAQAATINQLRMAFQVQRMLERDAVSGTRYIEVIKAHFGVTSPDARMMRAEYLGGNQLPINVNQVVQQSASISGSTPQGTPVGMSLTTDSHGDFIKSFTEHGWIIGLCCMRYDHTYQQGIERFWSRKTRFDWYWPTLAHIGNQAILNKEIYAQGTSEDDEVFGYQEAWAEYRYKANRVAGEMRSSAPRSLDVWHLGDDYSSLPSLSAGWIQEDKSNVDRVLAVTSEVSNQYFADFYIQCFATRPMPLYSTPGLIDHF